MNITNIIFPIISIGGLGLLFGLGLGYASKKFSVEIDPKIPLVRDELPGANCGGCGFVGCDAFAKAVVEGSAPVNGCPVGGTATVENIAKIVGTVAEAKEKMTAYVKCKGSSCHSKNQYMYDGVLDCRAAALLQGGGPKSCSYGCLGLGTCAKICPFGAIAIIDGIAVINEAQCTACSQCVVNCPKALIELIPAKNSVRVACNSSDFGKEVKKNCSVGCIGCRICEKVCSFGAIEIKNNVAKVDYSKCTHCMACVKKCPTHAIEVNQIYDFMIQDDISASFHAL